MLYTRTNKTNLYDENDDFDFHIINCLFMFSKIPTTFAYGVKLEHYKAMGV